MVLDGVLTQCVDQPGPGRAGVGHGLEGGEGLGGDHNEGACGFETPQLEVEVCPVHVGHEAEVKVPVDEGVECDGGHGRAEVGAADADVDDVGQPLSSDASAFPGTHGGGEASHLVQDIVHIGNDVVAPVFDDRARRRSKGGVENGPVFGEVDVLSREHGVPKAFDLGRSSQVGEQADRLPGDPVLRVVEVEIPDLDDEVGAPSRVVGEEVSEVDGGEGGSVVDQGRPFRRLVDWRCHEARLRLGVSGSDGRGHCTRWDGWHRGRRRQLGPVGNAITRPRPISYGHCGFVRVRCRPAARGRA